jgi:hypothetical protein
MTSEGMRLAEAADHGGKPLLVLDEESSPEGARS